MRSRSRTLWLMVALVTICLVATAAPVGGAGQKGKKKPPPAVKQVPVLKFMIYNTAHLLNDENPVQPYVDHRISTETADPCVTGWINKRGGIFAYLYKGSSDPAHPLFDDCHQKIAEDPEFPPPTIYRGPRSYILRLPDDGAYDIGQGTCCEVLELEPDSEGYCTLPVPEGWDYGSQRIRVGDVFGRKLEPVALDFLFYHTVGEARRSFELQSERALLAEDDGGDLRSILTTEQDTFRLVEIGGPEVCSGFPFLLYMEFHRVYVPEGG